MNKHALLALSFVLILATTAIADSRIVAVPEFQNNSDRVLQISRWDLAVWTANDLKKTGEFQPVDRKKVNEVVKDAVWVDERMRTADEQKLQQNLSAKYVVYGTVVKWEVANMGSQHEGMKGTNFKAVSPAVMVVLSFDLVDLATGEVVKNVVIDGNAVGADETTEQIDQPLQDDRRYKDLFEDASKKAIRKATQKLADYISGN